MVKPNRAAQVHKNESGQALTEYLLILSVIVVAYVGMVRVIENSGLQRQLLAPITTSFAAAYQYGHTKGKGYDDGGPENHPRATASRGRGGTGGANNFRIFFNPRVGQ